MYVIVSCDVRIEFSYFSIFFFLFGSSVFFFFFFFNDTATTEIYTLSLHDALPICRFIVADAYTELGENEKAIESMQQARSEEHTSELQSRLHLVCRLLLEKKKK